MEKRLFSARSIAVCAMLSAVSFILMYLEFPLPMLIPPFIKFDFSDLPALIGGFALGPVYGIIIALVKNVLHMPFSQTAFVGELSNFILGATFAGVAGLIYSLKKTKKTAIIAGLAGAVVMGLLSIVSNYYFVYPVYYNFMPEEAILAAYQLINPKVNSIFECLIFFNVPFTIGKGLVNVLICSFVYKPLSRLIKEAGKRN